MTINLTTAGESSQPISITWIISTLPRATEKIVSVLPAVQSDEKLLQIDPWIQAGLILADLIRPANEINERAVA